MRFFGILIALAVGLTVAFAVRRSVDSTRSGQQADLGPRPQIDAAPSAGGRVLAVDDPACRGSVTFDEAARQNAVTVSSINWSPFGRAEVGWMTYWPLIADEIDSGCGPTSPEFAERLAAWQQANGFDADGVLTPEQFDKMRIAWHQRRPYVALRGEGVCPDPPASAGLATAAADESFGGKSIQLRPGALSAYRRMVEAAQNEVPGLKDDPQMLDIFSGFRSPESDAARCARDGNCDGIVRAKCSPHRTGLALDIVVGAAPGHRVDSSADLNRLAMSQTPAYQWLVANADRFGFVNYPFEPWHWEWTGQAVAERNTPRTP